MAAPPQGLFANTRTQSETGSVCIPNSFAQTSSEVINCTSNWVISLSRARCLHDKILNLYSLHMSCNSYGPLQLNGPIYMAIMGVVICHSVQLTIRPQMTPDRLALSVFLVA